MELVTPMDTCSSYQTGLVQKAPEPVVFSDSMEVVLQEFLSSKFYVSTLCEGFFAVLMKDLRKEVWSQIDDDKTFAVAMRVNKRWRSELEEAWKVFGVERKIFDEYWFSVGKDWKWQIRAWRVVYPEGEIRNGPGTFHDKNGPYTGDWKESKQDGWGKKIFTDKSVYLGQWRDNLKHGEGTYVWEDKTKYSGAWRDDKYHGFGIKTWSDGDRYEGMWREDKKHG